MRPQSAKAKGRRHQQHIAKTILDAFPHLLFDDVVSRPMGSQGEDLMLSTAARQCLPLSIEAKNVEKINVWSCISQCEANAPSGATPCLVFTRNHAKTYAVLPWEVLLDLYKRLANAGAEIPPRLGQLLREISAFAPEAKAEGSSSSTAAEMSDEAKVESSLSTACDATVVETDEGKGIDAAHEALCHVSKDRKEP